MPISAVDSALGTVNQSPDTGSGIAQIPSGIQAGMQLAQKAQALQLQQQEIEFTKQRIESAKNDHEMGLWRQYHDTNDDPDAQKAVLNDLVNFRNQRGKETNPNLVKLMGKSTSLQNAIGHTVKLFDSTDEKTRNQALQGLDNTAAGTVSNALKIAQEIKSAQLREKIFGYKQVKDSTTTGVDTVKLAQLKATADMTGDPNDIQNYQDELAKQNSGSFKGRQTAVAERNATSREKTADLSQDRFNESVTKGKTTAALAGDRLFKPTYDLLQQADNGARLLQGNEIKLIDAKHAAMDITRLVTKQNRVAYGLDKDTTFTGYMVEAKKIADEIGPDPKETAVISAGEAKIMRDRIQRIGAGVVDQIRSGHERYLNNMKTIGRFNDTDVSKLRQGREDSLKDLKYFYHPAAPTTGTQLTPETLKQSAINAIHSGGDINAIRQEYINQMKQRFNTDADPVKDGL